MGNTTVQAKGLVLVTGAAGGPMGGTGRQLSELLLRRGWPVRALVRTDDDRAAALRAAGAEVVVGDMLSLKDMTAAARGAHFLFFCFPVEGGLLEATAIAAIAAKQAGLKGVLNLSQWCAKLDSHSPQSRQHALSEAIFDTFGTPTVQLQPAIFHENVFKNFFKEAAITGKLRIPTVESKDAVPLIAGADVSTAAAGILQHFDAYAGKAVLLVTELLSVQAIAATFSQALGKQVAFEQITPDAWEAMTVAHWGPRVQSAALVHLRALWAIVRMRNANPAAIGAVAQAVPTLPGVLGQEPLAFADWLGPYLKNMSAN